ncbi:hypothetical protein M0R45_031330 [Rubus argutus]|uniref:Uncharacterized protein n=1 Tax=Rubus argutus TaxID=59490 RepID=A0AAW1WHW1_RUBAR
MVLHKHSKAVSTGTLTFGLLTTVLSVVYSAVRAGSSTTLLSPPNSPRAGAGKPLLSIGQGGSTSVGESGKLIDVGWPSVWVRVMTSWATAGSLHLVPLAPILFPEREF